MKHCVKSLYSKRLGTRQDFDSEIVTASASEIVGRSSPRVHDSYVEELYASAAAQRVRVENQLMLSVHFTLVNYYS